MDWGHFANEVLKAYHLDGIIDSVTNFSTGVPSKSTLLLSCVRNYLVLFVKFGLIV